MEFQFECQRCGFCCKTLFEINDNIVIGLSLFPDEIQLFDSKLIAPFSAFGADKPTTITTYQLTVAICPHLNEKNECRIYDKRPLLCKAFPVISRFILAPELATKCPEIGNRATVGENVSVHFKTKMQEEALTAINLRTMANGQSKEKNSKLWTYNLATKSWINSNHLCQPIL